MPLIAMLIQMYKIKESQRRKKRTRMKKKKYVERNMAMVVATCDWTERKKERKKEINR
jgi:Pyruvate/2-oxoacid:ferredoxin oxidoreductase gamma subunit